MNYQLKGTTISLLLHAAVISALLSFASYAPVKKQVIALDFSIIDGKQQQTSKGKNIVKEVKQVKAVKPKPLPGKVVEKKKIEPKKVMEEIGKPVPQKVAEPEPVREIVKKPEIIPATEPVVAPETTEVAEATPETENPADSENETIETDRVAETENSNSNDTSDNSAMAAKERYVKDHFAYIKDKIEKEIVYPRIARRRGLEGKVILSFVICEDGTVHGINIVEKSGYTILDKNAVATVKRAAPFPPPPVRAEIVLPLSYRLG